MTLFFFPGAIRKRMTSKGADQVGILAGITGPHHFRMVCHYWITDNDIGNVRSAFEKALNLPQ